MDCFRPLTRIHHEGNVNSLISCLSIMLVLILTKLIFFEMQLDKVVKIVLQHGTEYRQILHRQKLIGRVLFLFCILLLYCPYCVCCICFNIIFIRYFIIMSLKINGYKFFVLDFFDATSSNNRTKLLGCVHQNELTLFNYFLINYC